MNRSQDNQVYPDTFQTDIWNYIVALPLTRINKSLSNVVLGEMDYRFHAAHLDRGLTIHEAVPGGFNRAGEGL